jgi:hypothetical protein
MLTACLGSTAPLPAEEEAGGLKLFAPAPPATPHPRRSEVEAFQNSRRRGLTTTVRWSVPAFLLQTPGGAPALRRGPLRTTGHQLWIDRSGFVGENGRGRGENEACPSSTASLPSERPFRASSSGSLLEFLQSRSCDRSASVSSSFPSRRNLGGSPLLRQSPL